MQKEKQSVKISSLSYSVNGKTILADASFEVEKNKFLGIVGPTVRGNPRFSAF